MSGSYKTSPLLGYATHLMLNLVLVYVEKIIDNEKYIECAGKYI